MIGGPSFASINFDVRVNVEPGKSPMRYHPLGDSVIIKVVRQNLLLSSRIPYQAANVFSLADPKSKKSGGYRFLYTLYLFNEDGTIKKVSCATRLPEFLDPAKYSNLELIFQQWSLKSKMI